MNEGETFEAIIVICVIVSGNNIGGEHMLAKWLTMTEWLTLTSSLLMYLTCFSITPYYLLRKNPRMFCLLILFIIYDKFVFLMKVYFIENMEFCYLKKYKD